MHSKLDKLIGRLIADGAETEVESRDIEKKLNEMLSEIRHKDLLNDKWSNTEKLNVFSSPVPCHRYVTDQ